MKTPKLAAVVSAGAFVLGAAAFAAARQAGGPDVTISGELRQWHKVTLTLAGPQADETSASTNPFMDYRMTVTFTHESGAPTYRVPGYFAADGNAANTSATAGNRWRAHLSPDKPGGWSYHIAFRSGRGVAVDPASDGRPVTPFDGATGSFTVGSTDKQAPDFGARGRLQYVGGHFLRFAGTGEYFLKLGSDSPETLLAFEDFDGTEARKPEVPLHRYPAHVADWREGDPTWKNGRGKGLIGAINYLASQGANSISFLPYNAGGDGDNVWPFTRRDDKLHYDVSKLDQWQIVFDHAQRRGMYLHFKLQEQEIDDNVRGNPFNRPDARTNRTPVAESLDGGDLGQERRLYIRELVARFGYLLALNWNIGEENTQTSEQQLAMAMNIRSTDPYGHHVVIHTYPNAQESVYPELLGPRSPFTGASLQMPWNAAHERTLRWVRASAEARKPWVVAFDEQGPSGLGVPPDPGYAGFKGIDAQGEPVGYTIDDIRKLSLWGTLMAGGAGVEYYFGYRLADNDLVAENFRSRQQSWSYGRLALEFFRAHAIPFWEMRNADELVNNPKHENTRFCLAKPNELYLVYLPAGGTTSIDLSGATGEFGIEWFNPRTGGPLGRGSVTTVKAGAPAALGAAPEQPSEDWLIVVRRR